MQRMMQIPSALIGALNGLIVLLVVGSEFLRRHRIKRAEKPESEQGQTSVEEEEA
jgi:simple sugar transport system permease protein